MPATLCSVHGWQRKPLKPVFFAPTDIQPGGLTAELQERLKASRHLIVICSPNSAKSEWVGKEIAYFHSLGRTNNIHFFIVDGTPHSGNEETECFNPVIDTLGIPEILGADIHAKAHRWPWLNRERAYVQLITKLLGVEFDSIWQRHKRMLVRKVSTFTVAVILVSFAIFMVWKTNRPFNQRMCLVEVSAPNANLPQMDSAIVTLTLNNEEKKIAVCKFGNEFSFNNIPAQFRNTKMPIKVKATGYWPLDTAIILNGTIYLPLRRDNTFAIYNGQIVDNNGSPVSGVQVHILDFKTETNDSGCYYIYIPVEKQRRTNTMTLSKEGYANKVMENMLPGENDFIFD